MPRWGKNNENGREMTEIGNDGRIGFYTQGKMFQLGNEFNLFPEIMGGSVTSTTPLHIHMGSR